MQEKTIADSVIDFVKNYIFPFVRKHPCLSVFLFSILLNRDIVLAYYVANPIRCQMWQDKNIKVFLTPEEWRSLSGVKESLKRTRWLSLSTDEGILFLENGTISYKNKMYFDGKEYYLSYFNREYPNLNIYENYIHDNGLYKSIIIFYDHRIEKKIVKYRLLQGTYKDPIFGLRVYINCDNEKPVEELMYTYLN